MGDLTLRGQYETARRLLQSGQFLTALQVCRRILSEFPKHTDTYSLLAQTCLQVGQLNVARDLFLRVLGVDPEHVAAYACLSRIYEEQGLLDEALWHLERAFELSPGSSAVRRDLQRLYQDRNLPVPERITLSRAALARAYMRGQLYGKAVEELGALVAEEPRRYDLQAALAESLWQEGRCGEAAEVCQTLLVALPNCLKAMLILGQVWLTSGREEDGRALLQQAQIIDPENNMAQAIFARCSPLAPRTPRLPVREEEAPPLDLPYLMADDEPEANRGSRPGARPRKARSRPTAAPSSNTASSPSQFSERLLSLLDNEPGKASQRDAASWPEFQGGDEQFGEPEDADEAQGDILPEGPVEGLSLLDVQSRYVAEHPDDGQARLDLARRLRDAGRLGEALAQYAFLIRYDFETLAAVINDLEFLKRIYPGTPAIEALVADAHERDSRQPPPAKDVS